MMNFKIFKKIKLKYKQIKQRASNKFYISIGENCLTDNILDRYNLKSFSTPYSHGRSNLDYAIKLEKEGYSNLLKKEFLTYDYVEEIKVVRNKYYIGSDDIYSKLHQNGFEFTHHDVLNNSAQRKSYERKILRMCTINKWKHLKFLYHYRINDNMNLKLIIEKAEEFLEQYRKKKIKCEFIFFTQDIIHSKRDRTLTKIHDAKDVRGFIFHTLEIWAGDNQDILWARKDDDLIKKMLKEIE